MSVPLVVFGVQPFATWTTLELLQTGSYELLGVVSRKSDRHYGHHGLSVPPLYSWARQNDVTVASSMSELRPIVQKARDCLGVSARWDKIIRPNDISLFARGIVNCHGGLLPRWRGVDIPSHLVLEGASIGGATLHMIDETVDTGAIVDRRHFDIMPNSTAYDIYLQTQDALKSLIQTNAASLMDAHAHCTIQESDSESRTYRASDAIQRRNLVWPANFDEIERTARAFSFPGRPGATLTFGMRTVNLTANHLSSGFHQPD